MTQVATDTDPKAKRMRRIARVLALIWAVCWTVASAGLLLAWVYSCGKENSADRGQCFSPLDWLYPLIVIYLLAWAPTAIAWRRETVGGVMLVVTGGVWLVSGAPYLLGSIWWPLLPWGPQRYAFEALLLGFALLLFSGPPLAAGFLLLASGRTSKSSEIRPGSE